MMKQLDFWLNNAPVVSFGSYQFTFWLDNAPVIEQDVLSVVTTRRRVWIY